MMKLLADTRETIKTAPKSRPNVLVLVLSSLLFTYIQGFRIYLVVAVGVLMAPQYLAVVPIGWAATGIVSEEGNPDMVQTL